jgi:hypothetical protein
MIIVDYAQAVEVIIYQRQYHQGLRLTAQNTK